MRSPARSRSGRCGGPPQFASQSRVANRDLERGLREQNATLKADRDSLQARLDGVSNAVARRACSVACAVLTVCCVSAKRQDAAMALVGGGALGAEALAVERSALARSEALADRVHLLEGELDHLQRFSGAEVRHRGAQRQLIMARRLTVARTNGGTLAVYERRAADGATQDGIARCDGSRRCRHGAGPDASDRPRPPE